MFKQILFFLLALGFQVEIKAQEPSCPLAFPQINMCASVEWVIEPSTRTEAKALIRYWDASSGTVAGPYLDPSEVPFVKLWMADHGHGSSPTRVTRQNQGTYLVTNMHFVMRGQWQVQVQRKNSQGQVIESAFLVKDVLR